MVLESRPVAGNLFGLSVHIHQCEKFPNKNINLVPLFYLLWKKLCCYYLIWNSNIQNLKKKQLLYVHKSVENSFNKNNI